jgi:hypothetical protein
MTSCLIRNPVPPRVQPQLRTQQSHIAEPWVMTVSIAGSSQVSWIAQTVMSLLVESGHVRFVNVLPDRAFHVPTFTVPRCTVWWYRVLSCRCGSAMGQWQGLVPALGPGVRSLGPSPESLVSSAAKRFDTTSGDVDVSLATFAVLRLSPG